MPKLREKYRISWGDEEPVEIITTVQDYINARDRLAGSTSENNLLVVNVASVYSALERSGAHNPPPWDEWLDLLDLYEPVPTGSNGEGPTQAAPSPIEPSSSPASLEPTGGPGSTETPAPSTPTAEL